MELTKQEKNWLDLVKEKKELYRISVDNDAVWVDVFIEDENEWECCFTFNNYGQEFIVQILLYIGCNAECV